MLQSVEYRPQPFLRWFWRTQDFSRIMYRRTLDPTRIARILRIVVGLGMATQLVLGLLLVYAGIQGQLPEVVFYGLAVMISYPVVGAQVLAIGIACGQVLFIRPREARQATVVQQIFHNHPGLRIAIAGSYGKTTMKELLLTVLSEGKKVAATPANMNVVSSHARFARSLSGDEEIVIVEFGEGRPGDVALFSRVVQPTHAVITGLAPAHLDQYKTLEAAGKDIFSLASYVPTGQVYVNAEPDAVHDFLRPDFRIYSRTTTLGWHVQKVETGVDGTTFELVKGKRRLKLKSGLIGLHTVGPLAFVAAFSLQLGLTEAQVAKGIAKTKPFEHRMQPYNIGGATVIDDTYNGNLEGIRAGTELLATLKAKRKIYVTPGLVDQGKETAAIHQEVGALIAAVKPDVVVLMQNSVTKHIQAGLHGVGYGGEIIVQDDPLHFYTNLDSFVASGDVVLMQNDWTDNYA
jgi:UDP-N-acetylmuramoyl-tripeptide--D-alanyl-D-alanine ligase